MCAFERSEKGMDFIMTKSKYDYVQYKDLKELLNYIFPDVNDWIHNKIIPNLIVNGEHVKLRPAYRSEKLKLIILYNYVGNIPDYYDHLSYILTLENNKYIYQKAGYRVVEIPSSLSLSQIKNAFDKKDYTYIKTNKRDYPYIRTNKIDENFKNNPIDNETIHQGNIVKVLDMDYDEEIDFNLVDTSEIDLTQNKISIDSLIGKALLGKKVNQIIEVNVLVGIIKLKILKIT